MVDVARVLTAIMVCAGAARANVTVSVAPYDDTFIVGYPGAIAVTLHNTDTTTDAPISNGQWSASVSPASVGSANTNSAPLPDHIPAGGDVVTGCIFYPTAPGMAAITVSFSGISPAPGPVTITRRVYSTNETAAIHGAGPRGMTIRHNIVRLKYGGGGASPGFESPALVLLHGAPDGKVQLDIAGPTGRPLGEINRTFFIIGQDSGSTVTLNKEGNGSCTIEGSANGVQLGTGMFWVMASGAVVARLPLMVISSK